MSITLPVPVTLLQVTWEIIGLMFGKAFGKRLDQTIKKTAWFKEQGLMAQKLVGCVLDFLHHFWIGLLLMAYLPSLPEAYWLGYGLLIDDIPNIPPRFARYFTYLST